MLLKERWIILLIRVYFVAFIADSQRIARRKCYEYSKAVYQEGDRIFMFRSHTPPKLHSTCAFYDNPLIVGGTPARPKEFPHMAVIGFGSTEDSDLDWLCGGSLISDRHILTAAHCTISQSGPPQKVRLGTVNLTANDDFMQEIEVDRFVNHPDYKRPIKYHDIAVLFLKELVLFSAFVRPACLSTFDVLPYNQATATGFGKTVHGKDETSDILLKVELNIIDNDNCSDYLSFREQEMPEKLIKGMICAGYLEGGKDTCQGDSGGPLQIVLDEPYCMYSVIGVTSFGRFCGMSHSPGIYTRVDQYVSWIETVIWQRQGRIYQL